MSTTNHGTCDWPPAWLATVRRRLGRWCASGAGLTWVVAVSGGGDSVGLLRVLHFLAPELGLTLSVAHLDHGVRADSGADAAFVKDLAGRLGLSFDLGHWRPSRAGHFEADARQARYGWLREVALARHATAVAVGHTRDDQAETVLHRIIRGTGPRGLAGMPSRRLLNGDPPIALLRPLLTVFRQEVRDSLRALGQNFREDESNTDVSRTRARIRHDLLPRLIADYNPRAVEAIVRLSRLAELSTRALDRRLESSGRDMVLACGADRIELRREALLEVPAFLRIELLRKFWRRAGWPEREMSASRWRRLNRMVCSPRIGPQDIGAGIVVSSSPELDRVILQPRHERELATPINMAEVALEVPGAVTWGGGWIVTLVDSHSRRDETIDLDRIVPPLRVRRQFPGDRFAPLGMAGRSTPLNDFFRSRKIGRGDRALIPLVCDSEGIIWIPGHRIADRVKTSERTSRTLGLRWEPKGSDVP